MESTSALKALHVIQAKPQVVLKIWVEEQMKVLGHSGRIKEKELREQSEEFLKMMKDLPANSFANPKDSTWHPMRAFLAEVSKNRAMQGFSPSETATFVFSLKKPLVDILRDEVKNSDELFREVWCVSNILDELGLWTTEAYQKTRDEIIGRQQQELMELSTPVVKLWDGVLALPLIGTLDSARTQTVMETLLQTIVDTSATVAILDITGVPTVDTLVAQHLLKTVTAARLMGAECIISGIRPHTAQTIVHLGVDLSGVITKSTLADAFALALERTKANPKSTKLTALS